MSEPIKALALELFPNSMKLLEAVTNALEARSTELLQRLNTASRDYSWACEADRKLFRSIQKAISAASSCQIFISTEDLKEILKDE